jgi:hypothetical protein
LDLGVRITKIEKTLKEVKNILVSQPQNHNIKEEADILSNSRISARDPYSYALQAMDVLFDKEELAASLLFKSKKSSKPSLDPTRVELMLSHIDNRFGKTWDIKMLTQKANQKCRDSRLAQSGEATPKGAGSQTGADVSVEPGVEGDNEDDIEGGADDDAESNAEAETES